MRFLFLMGFLFCSSAFADEKPKTLTVQQVISVNVATSKMSCGDRTLKDGAKETQVCEPYKWSPGLTWQIATVQQKTQEITSRYARVRNQTLAQQPRSPDGNLTQEAAVKFTLQDSELLDAQADVDIPHFKRTDLEPMNLPPAVIAALMPIID